LIGVLEYANLFISHGNPALSMLQVSGHCSNLMGKLIIAIENQLGLKYFAGAPEDSFGEIDYGIRITIKMTNRKHTAQSAFRDTQTSRIFTFGIHGAIPDYKLPVSIITESGFSYNGFDAGALAWQSVKLDPQLPQFWLFLLSWFGHPWLRWSWPGFFKFISCCGRVFYKSESRFFYPCVHFSSERSKEFCKGTRFCKQTRA